MTNAKTQLFAVLGHPIEHTLSPQLHSKLLEISGYNGIYIAFHTTQVELSADVAFLSRRARGFNCTLPHKQAIIPLLEEIDEAAKFCGSVNTVLCDEGKLYGTSTDGAGLMRALGAEDMAPHGKRVLITGAGGVARVAAYECALVGAEITIAARRKESALSLCYDVMGSIKGAKATACGLENIVGTYDLFIQCTPVGMYPNVNQMPVDEKTARSIPLVFDTIYNPYCTQLLQTAKVAGAKVANGLGMLIYQGVAAQEIWTGHRFLDKDIKEIAKSL